ncbi:MAG: hypothetical protein AAFO99_11050 [Bacteroidota bacterium]
MDTKRITYYFKVFFFFLIATGTCAQNKEMENDFDASDVLTLEAPSAMFKPIHLQQHMGLPRFGTLNRYHTPGVRKNSAAINAKLRKIDQGYRNFRNMLKLRSLRDTYTDLNQKKITSVVEKEQSEAASHSYALQQLLQTLSGSICAQEACVNGFKGTNEFERMRNYQNFIETYWSPLHEWAGTFFKDNNIQAYTVKQVQLGSYDFDKSGYWILMSLNDGVRSSIPFFKILVPQNAYEKELLKRLPPPRPGRAQTMNVLFPISTEKAEALIKRNIRSLYLVKKVTVVMKEGLTIAGRFPHPYAYHHDSPILEMYEDAALTKKTGSISLDNITLKKP